MASLCTVKISVIVEDPTGIVLDRDLLPVKFTPGAGISGLMETVVLPGTTFTAITVPTGSKLMLVEVLPAAVSLILKGVTGDTGIPVTPAANFPGLPLLIPLGASPTVGFLNNASTSVSLNVTFV